MENDFLVLKLTDFWDDLRIPIEVRTNRIEYYFGNKPYTITDLEYASTLLKKVLDTSIKKISHYINSSNLKDILWELGLLQNIVYQLYVEQRKVRQKVKDSKINKKNLIVELIEYSKIAKQLFDSINLWIENTLILNQSYTTICKNRSNKEQQRFCVDLFIYGITSYNITLIEVSRRMKSDKGVKLIDISPQCSMPINSKFKSIAYFNPVIMGNQGWHDNQHLFDDFDNSKFNISFESQFNINFMDLMALFYSVNDLKFADSNCPANFINFETFKEFVTTKTKIPISFNSMCNNFVLTREKLISQLQNDKYIWKMNVNRFRLELCPFIMLKTGEVMVSRAIAEYATQLWLSCHTNGGVIYTNTDDSFKKYLINRNKSLSNTFLDEIKSVFSLTIDDAIIELNVRYDVIWNKKDIDYGDYDLLVYSPKKRLLYVVESKFITDSLNASSYLRDFEEMYKNDGHYYKFKRRCDLVQHEPEKLKKFFNISGDLEVQFLYITSKPIQTESIDDGERIFFLCLENLKYYLEEKLIDPDGNTVSNKFCI